MAGRLQGRIAVVTGGGRGIGRAVVDKLVEEGARVAFLDCDEVPAPAGVRFIRADVASEPHVQAAVAEVVAAEGGLDVLVNNAGVNAYYEATTMSEAEWDQTFAVDLKGTWLCAKYALPAMKRGGGGAIVNIASIHARLTTSGMFPYAAAKAGVVGLTRSLALDYGPFNIRVNAVLPGYTRTRLTEEWISRQPDPLEAERRVLSVHPLGRIATPAEVANLVAFVASDEASAITGASLAVDCGLGARFAS